MLTKDPPGKAVEPYRGEDRVALDPVAQVLDNVEQEAGKVAHQEHHHDADQDNCQAAVRVAVPSRDITIEEETDRRESNGRRCCWGRHSVNSMPHYKQI